MIQAVSVILLTRILVVRPLIALMVILVVSGILEGIIILMTLVALSGCSDTGGIRNTGGNNNIDDTGSTQRTQPHGCAGLDTVRLLKLTRPESAPIN